MWWKHALYITLFLSLPVALVEGVVLGIPAGPVCNADGRLPLSRRASRRTARREKEPIVLVSVDRGEKEKLSSSKSA